jgi:hypothetical protein
MLSIPCWFVLAGAGPATDPEYSGPAYTERAHPPDSLAARCRGEALVWVVRAGAGPDLINRAFGTPALTEQFRRGPVEWWYLELGVKVYFPPRLLRPPQPTLRVRCGIL